MPRLPLIVLPVMSLCVGLTGCSGNDEPPDSASGNPNFLVFIADDQFVGSIGAYGAVPSVTPNIDRFADEGFRFTSAYTTSPICTPARASLYTGMYPIKNGAHANHSGFKRDIPSMPTTMEALGYRTAIVGKRHIRKREPLPSNTFEWTDHVPLSNTPVPGSDRSDRRQHEELDRGALRNFMAGSLFERVFFRNPKPFLLVVASSLPHVPHLTKLESGLEGYDASNATLDRHFGEVLQALDQAGVADNTVVFYLSDHGGNVDDSKFTLYEPGVRIPLLVKAPGHSRSPADSGALVSIIDILPTMIEMAGGKPSSDIDGRSLEPLLYGEASTHHEQIFMSFTAAGVKGVNEPFPIRAIRTPEYKLVHYLNHDNAHPVSVGKYAVDTVGDVKYFKEYELFDQGSGFEGKNLSGSPELAGVEANLKAALDGWMFSMGDHGVETELAVFEVIGEREDDED